MQYKANVNYKIVYLTKTGEEKEIDFTPEKDMNIAELITTIKSNNADFFKLKSANEINGDENMKENKKVVTESEEMLTNLYDVLEARNFEDVDITDKEIDIMVAYSLDPELGDTDSYDAFLTTLAKELTVDPMTAEDARKANIITVDLYQWVEDNFDKLDSLLDVSASNKEEEAIRITEMMEGIISGAASDEFYNELMRGKSLTEADDEDDEDDEEFEEVETDEIKEPIEQEEEFEEIPADSDTIENDNTEELPGTGESTEETKEAVKDAIDEVKENITAEDAFAVETSNSSISVLIADEQSAIDGYNAFLNQTRDTLIPALYEVLEKEIQEIIADEEDHINKLNAIKDNFKIQNLPPINEEKTINYKEKIVDYFKQKGLSDDEIALKILDDILNTSILEFALKQLSDKKAKEYYTELAEMYESKDINKDSSLDDIAQYIIDNFEEITGIKIDNVFNKSDAEDAQIFNQDIIDATYPSIEKYLKEKGITSDEDLLDIIDDKLFTLKNKSLQESVRHLEDLQVGDEVTIPYARGPRYTQDRSEWVKGKILNINPDYTDLEVPTTLTVSTSQLNKWLSKEESKLTEQIITSSGQEFGDMYDDIYNKKVELDREFGSDYGTIGRSNPNNKYKDKLDKIDKLLDIIASENKGKSDLDDVRVLFDLGTIDQQEELRNLVTESKVVKEDHQLYYDDIQNMSTEERHNLWMKEHDVDFEDTDIGNDMFWDWAEEEFPVKELNEDKNEKVKVEDVITFLDADIDSPYAEASWDEIQEFIDENPDMTAREIAIGYKNYEETGEFNVPEFNIEDAAVKVQQEAEEHYKGSEINADTLDRVARRFFSLEYTEDQLDELQKYFEEQEKKWIASEGGYIEESKSE